MYIAAAKVYLTIRFAWATPFLPASDCTPRVFVDIPFQKRLRIIRFPLAKRIRQTTTNNVRNTQTNSSTPHQPSRSKFAAESLLPPSSQNQVCCAPCGRQTRAVSLETVDVEVGAEEEDWWKEHGQRLERASMLGHDESCEESRREWVL
jgi:hypothetical protein